MALALLALAVFTCGANSRELKGIDVQYAETARQILVRGDALTLVHDDRLYVNKPPLVLWLSALSMAVLGEDAAAARLPTALFGVLAVVATTVLVRRFVGRAAGWIAGLAMTTTSFFFDTARDFRMDTALAAGIALALIGYRAARHHRWGPWLFFAGVVLGMLTKGPQGLLPIPLALMHAAWCRRLAWPWSRSAAPWWAAASLLLLPAAWYVAQRVVHGAGAWEAMATDAGNKQADTDLAGIAWYFLRNLVSEWWPWWPLAAVGAVWSLRRLCSAAAARPRRAFEALCWLWIGVVVAVTAWKRSEAIRYLVTCAPVMALFAARPLARLARGRLPPWLPATCGVVGAAALTIVGFLPLPDAREATTALGRELDRHLAPAAAVTLVPVDDNSVWWCRSWTRFHLRRDATLVGLEAVPPGPVLIDRKRWGEAQALGMSEVARSRTFVLALRAP
ncbi:MAG TPA: glycosyltransferase family 39 protein [Planctomycetota bacterium]|nr:glycosyltransferase family 39 protein [Planctomycetota bacterium]